MQRIFDGEKGSPIGRARLLQAARGPRALEPADSRELVELGIVERASDSTIQRALKLFNPIAANAG